MGLNIRKAKSGDSSAILQLLKDTFSGYWSASQSLYTEDFWRWLYLANFGGGSITFVAEDNNKVVGHFPNVLGRVKIGGDIFLTGTVLHLSTHQDYRRKGIFESLGKASSFELANSGVPFSLAFPNDKSRPGFIKKLGFRPIATLPLLVKPLQIKNIIARIIKHKAASEALSFFLRPLYHLAFHHYRPFRKYLNLEITENDTVREEFTELWEKASTKMQVSMPRNSSFLNWRFRQRPNANYKIFTTSENGSLAGYIVTRTADMFSLKAGIIMDFLTITPDVDIFSGLLNKAVEGFKEEGLDLCVAACLKGNSYYGVFKDKGFIPILNRFNPRKLVLVGKANGDIVNNLFFNEKSWFITFADWDVL